MDPLKNAKLADSKAACAVFGYIHDMESKLKLAEIASLIMNIVLGFYYHGEFITNFQKASFKLSDDKLTITKLEDSTTGANTVYLNQWFESTSSLIVKWTFKINKIKEEDEPRQSNELFFGLTSIEKSPNYDFAEYEPSYCVERRGLACKGIEIGGNYEEFSIITGDFVTFTLDLMKKKWYGRIDRQGSVGEEIEFFALAVGSAIKYKFVLQMSSKGNSVTLTNFEIHH